MKLLEKRLFILINLRTIRQKHLDICCKYYVIIKKSLIKNQNIEQKENIITVCCCAAETIYSTTYGYKRTVS